DGQDLVPESVSIGVVDRLEAIQVEEQYADELPSPGAAGQAAQRGAVRHPGQLVGVQAAEEVRGVPGMNGPAGHGEQQRELAQHADAASGTVIERGLGTGVLDRTGGAEHAVGRPLLVLYRPARRATVAGRPTSADVRRTTRAVPGAYASGVCEWTAGTKH